MAGLAKLRISDREAEHYSVELSKILEYVDQLSAAVTGDRLEVEMSGPTDRWRADEAAPWPANERRLALRQAEMTESNLVKVPKII